MCYKAKKKDLYKLFRDYYIVYTIYYYILTTKEYKLYGGLGNWKTGTITKYIIDENYKKLVIQ